MPALPVSLNGESNSRSLSVVFYFKTNEKGEKLLMQHNQESISYHIPVIIFNRLEEIDPDQDIFIEMAVNQGLSLYHVNIYYVEC